jgi:flagellar assembly protein FliH
MTPSRQEPGAPTSPGPSAVIKREEIGALTVRPWRVVAGLGANGGRMVASQAAVGGASETARDGSERLVQTCRSLAAALERQREGLLGALEPHLVRLVFAAAEAVIRREASVDPTFVERTVADALAATSQAAAITVRVAPGQTAQVEQVLAGADARVRVLADESITAGGCIAETDWGDIDATLETQLRALRDALLGTGTE